jgi:hypothetical protein
MARFERGDDFVEIWSAAAGAHRSCDRQRRSPVAAIKSRRSRIGENTRAELMSRRASSPRATTTSASIQHPRDGWRRVLIRREVYCGELTRPTLRPRYSPIRATRTRSSARIGSASRPLARRG